MHKCIIKSIKIRQNPCTFRRVWLILNFMSVCLQGAFRNHPQINGNASALSNRTLSIEYYWAKWRDHCRFKRPLNSAWDAVLPRLMLVIAPRNQVRKLMRCSFSSGSQSNRICYFSVEENLWAFWYLPELLILNLSCIAEPVSSICILRVMSLMEQWKRNIRD